MRYANKLREGDVIGVCAPSSGIGAEQYQQLAKAEANVRGLGYGIVETASVRSNSKCVSAGAADRADEFMSLYEDPGVAAIIPPRGGEFLMDMLPHLDFSRLSGLPPKWVCGYSDITTLTFPLTVLCDIAAVHGSNLMNMGFRVIHESDLAAFEAMSKPELTQKSSGFYGSYLPWDEDAELAYLLTEKTVCESLDGSARHDFEGRMAGGCMDVLGKLLGTKYAPVPEFLEMYRSDGFIWALESCEMNAADIYRTLWQMGECGWFDHCNGMIIGRPAGYSDQFDFTLRDALECGPGRMGFPVIYGADVGHVPPQTQIVNGSYGIVEFRGSGLTIRQEMRE